MESEEMAPAAGEADEGTQETSGAAQEHYSTDAQKLTITLWQNKSGSRRKELHKDWPEFCQWVADLPRVQAKDSCRLIKLARFGNERTDNGALRHDANLLAITGIEGDYDQHEVTPEQAVEYLEAHNLKAAVAPTFTSTPEAPRWRVLTPLSAEADPDQRMRLVEILNGMLGGILASESGTLSQSFYIGVPEGADYTVLHTFDDPEEGYCLDEIADGLDCIRRPVQGKTSTTATGSGSAFDPMDTSGVEDWAQTISEAEDIHPALTRLVGHYVAKGWTDEAIRAMCIGLAVNVQAKRGKERADYLKGKELTDAITSARGKGWAPRQYADILADAKEMDAETDPDAIEALAKETASLGSVEREKILKQMRKRTEINLSDLRDLAKEQARSKRKEIVQARSSGIEPMPEDAFPDVSYNEETGMVKIPATLPNVKAMLDYYGITATYDVIGKKTKVSVPGMQGSPDNADNSALTHVISVAKLNELSVDVVPSYVEATADERQVNPVADWIYSREWDGVDRLPEIYRTLHTKPDYPDELRDVLVRRWLVSAVAAALKPIGFRARGVLTLQGPQSIGKTSWLQSLVPDAQLRERLVKTDHLLDPANKDSVLGAVSHWLVELGELDGSFRKADVARIKGFITADADKIRRPYARLESEYQRRTVFFASVNDAQFLVDETGNSRFWTIAVDRIDYEADIDMQQLWRQIAHLWESGEQWWLTPDEEQQLEGINKGHRIASSVRELILSRLDFDAPPHAWESKTATEVCLMIDYDKPTNAQCREAGAVLREVLGEPTRSKGVSRWRVPCHVGLRDFAKEAG